MLSAHHLSKTYNNQTILQDVSINISAGERMGLIGPNGCGKSTLLRILAGEEEPDSGRVVPTRPGLRIGYLPQGFEFDPSLSLAEFCLLLPLKDPETELANLAAELAQHPTDMQIQARYEATLACLQDHLPHPERILAALGMAELSPETIVGVLSGGQKTRLMLARLLLQQPHLLLLDEPTNHLDITMLEWLETWLRNYNGAALIVSHDRVFLDHTVSSIIELDPSNHGVKQYHGNYSDYVKIKETEQEKQLQTYLDQQADIRRMQADIVRTKAQAAKTEREAHSIRIGGSDYKQKGYKSYQLGIAKKVAAKARSRQKKLDHFLASEEIVLRPRSERKLKLDLGEPEHLSRDVLTTEDLSVGYPECQPLLSGLRLYIQGGERVVLTGPNGCGKTSLLRTIAGHLSPIGGTIHLGTSIKIGFMAQEQENLDLELSPLGMIQNSGMHNTTRARSFLHAFLFSGDAPLRPCREMSYGERARLELALLIARGANFLLLDEPINHLDIPSRTRFEQALSGYHGSVLAVVHDRYFIEGFATTRWEIDEGHLHKRHA